ncbi:hypothetical protein GC194_14215 [bacterium]|nr:hypothetical protein [bacterium]
MKTFLLICTLSCFLPQAYTVRDAYHDIPINFLPVTKMYVADKKDNAENRDKILIYHNADREFIKLNYAGSPLTGKLQLFTAGSNIYVVVEHLYCKSGNCDNYFSILKKENGGYTEVTTQVLNDFDMNLGKLRGQVKSALKDAYGSNDFYDDLGYKDDETLRKHLIWELDDQTGEIHLKESTLPYTLASYKWNEKKEIFESK